MTYDRISRFAPINDVDNDKVKEIAESIKANGYVGCPILVFGESLLTGSHRKAALDLLDAEGYDDDTREKVHSEFAPCTEEEFLNGYLAISEDDLIIG